LVERFAHLTQRDIESEWKVAVIERDDKDRVFDRPIVDGLRTIVAGPVSAWIA
jgi:hypothetical protein